MKETDLLIIGAGPYGLAVGSYAQRLGLECRVVGKPMSFWRNHMPAGMLLRSPTSWHLDAAGELTFERFLQVRGLTPAQASPIALGLYLDYCGWFQAESGLAVEQRLVENLEWHGKGSHPFPGDTGRRQRNSGAAGAGHHRPDPIPQPAGRRYRPAAAELLRPHLRLRGFQPAKGQTLPHRGRAAERL